MSTEGLTVRLWPGEDRMVYERRRHSAMAIEQALARAAKYRVLALSEPNLLMIRLFEKNAHWLEGMAVRSRRSGNLLSEARS
jgi:hypothetical protein